MSRLDKDLIKMDAEKSGICHHMIFEKRYINEIIERIEKGGGYKDAKVIPNDEWFMYEKGNMDSIVAFLEQYRFKPKHPEMYPGYSYMTSAFSEVVKKVSPDVKMLKPRVASLVFIDDEDTLKEKFEELNISQ